MNATQRAGAGIRHGERAIDRASHHRQLARLARGDELGLAAQVGRPWMRSGTRQRDEQAWQKGAGACIGRSDQDRRSSRMSRRAANGTNARYSPPSRQALHVDPAAPFRGVDSSGVRTLGATPAAPVRDLALTARPAMAALYRYHGSNRVPRPSRQLCRGWRAYGPQPVRPWGGDRASFAQIRLRRNSTATQSRKKAVDGFLLGELARAQRGRWHVDSLPLQEKRPRSVAGPSRKGSTLLLQTTCIEGK
jgi:hypothetical protein